MAKRTFASITEASRYLADKYAEQSEEAKKFLDIKVDGYKHMVAEHPERFPENESDEQIRAFVRKFTPSYAHERVKIDGQTNYVTIDLIDLTMKFDPED